MSDQRRSCKNEPVAFTMPHLRIKMTVPIATHVITEALLEGVRIRMHSSVPGSKLTVKDALADSRRHNASIKQIDVTWLRVVMVDAVQHPLEKT